MKQTLITVAVAVALIVGAYFYGRMMTTEGIDAIVARHEQVLADTVEKLDAAIGGAVAAADAHEARVDTLVVRETRLVKTANMWAGEGTRTAGQLRKHLVAAGDTIGVSVLDNYVAQRDQEALSLRQAIFVADSSRFELLAANDSLRVAIVATEEKYAAAVRSKNDIVNDLKARDRHKTLKTVAKVGGTVLAVYAGCRLAPEDVC